MDFQQSFGWLFGVVAGAVIVAGFARREWRAVSGAGLALVAAFAMGYGFGHGSASLDAELHRIKLDPAPCLAHLGNDVESPSAAVKDCYAAISKWRDEAPRRSTDWMFLASALLMAAGIGIGLKAGAQWVDKEIALAVARALKGRGPDAPVVISPGGVQADQQKADPATDRGE